MIRVLLGAAAVTFAVPLSTPALAQGAPAEAVQPLPVKVEFYYRIHWGSLDEFVELYDRNHKPFLLAAQEAGLVLDMKEDVPYNHMVGEARWDLRVTITFRDASAALMTDPAWDGVYSETEAKLFTDKENFAAEEKRRFELVDEHWDVVLMP